MPKQIKENPRRKSPEPAAGHSDIDAWADRLMPDMQPIVRAVDHSIRATVHGLNYVAKYKSAFYGLPEHGWIVEMAPYAVSVNVLFLSGAPCEPPPPLEDGGQTR